MKSFYFSNLGGIFVKKIVFIGAGSMAEAMIGGLISTNTVREQDIYVTNRSNYGRLVDLQTLYRVQILENLQDISDASLIVLAMKPKDVNVAMQSIAPHLNDHTGVISVLAGISCETLEKGLYKRPIARVMPNTGAAVGLSATGVTFNAQSNETFKKTVISLLNAIGQVVEVTEDQIHIVTALSGSGPAYIYYLLEGFIEAGVNAGLSKEDVQSLMTQTIAGAAKMLETFDAPPEELRRKVTSPNGTTEAGIRALEQKGFKEAIHACVEAAARRSRELAAE